MIKRSTLLIVALLAAPTGCSAPSNQTARNANTPGWTGRTFVPGSTSTLAGNAVATDQQQKWSVTPAR
jgi:hypothetical protein